MEAKTLSDLFPLRPKIQNNPEPAAVVPHVLSFNAIFNTSQRLYSYRYDEALRHLPANALSMRRDAFINALHQERTFPTANRSWSIKVPDQKDVYQSFVAKSVTQSIRAIPRFDRLRLYMMEAVWYGRYGSHVSWGKRKLEGKELWTLAAHRPVNGDKIFHEFDGTPGVAISPTTRGSYPDDLTKVTDRGTALLLLRRPEHRRQFIIHQHLVNDADYFEPEMGGSIHGTGLRNQVYWAWWLRDEMLAWCTDFMQKVGTLGLLVFFYEDGNPAAKLAAEQAAGKASTEVALTMPMPNGPSVKPTNSVMHIPANTGGVEALQSMIRDYFESHIERLYVGQPSSGGVEGNGFGGSAGAALHADTKYQLLKFDAKNLDETLTLDLVNQIVLLNHPDVDFPVQFVSAVANPEDAAKLQGIVAAAGLGVTFKADEVRDLTGMSKPEEFDETVGGVIEDPMGGEGEGGFGKDDKSKPGQGVTSNANEEREKGSDGTKWADVAAYADDGTYFACYVEDEESGGHWVTIGARGGDDGKRHGGTPVLIKGGRIVKGPKGMLGKKPSEVGKGGPASSESEQRFGQKTDPQEPAYPPEWDEPLNDETASKKKPKLRVTDAMRKQLPAGVKMEHVAELAADIRDNHAAAADYHNEALRYARDRAVGTGNGDLSALVAKVHKRGGDVHSIKEYDLIAESMIEAYPGLIEGDPTTHASDKLFDLVLEGVKPKMTDREAWDLALEYVNENGLDRNDPEPEKRGGGGNAVVDEIGEQIGNLRGDPNERQAAEKIIDKVAGMKREELYLILTEAGLDGIKGGDSKPKLLQRLKNRLTAAVRARERAEV
jgi:hypothetical protein